PERTINFDIHPVGSYREEKRISEKKVHRKIVDLVFPVTNSFPMTTDGVRTKTDDLTRFQVEILDFLDTLTELNVVIKPIPNYSRKVCSVVDTIKHMQHATIHEGWSTNAWIKVYEPRALIIELPSTPLFELMAGDTEIFMLKDTLNPFSESALEMLKKRAHIFDDVADLKIAVLEWKSGSLPKLRDQSFYNHYVYKPNTHDRVIDLVNSLVRHAAN
ncbi:MAG: hypothetical protein JKX97_04080, partial [Candidatus Lindowbacteria bacterium]|nr:hypothetical protein [Candidatus Lindowbacteria bacterium]